jgi:hypothetical protein
VDALRFYQRRRFRLAALIRDELELEQQIGGDS